MRGQPGQFRRPAKKGGSLQFPRLMDNVQLPVGSIPAPRFYMTL